MKAFGIALLSLLAVACGGADSTGVTTSTSARVANVAVTNALNTAVAGQLVPVNVIVTNASGGVVSAAPLTFSITGGGTLSASGLVSDASGLASLQWTMGPTLGTQTLTIAVTGTSVSASYPISVVPLNVTGTWIGNTALSQQTLDITLIDVSGAVSGSGTLSSSTLGLLAQTVSGAFIAPTLTVTLTSGAHPPFVLHATLSGNNLVGTLNGSGFVNESITLAKQR